MPLVNLGSSTYDTSHQVDIDAIVDKINRAAAGEDVPGVHIIKLPAGVLTGGNNTAVKSANSSLITYGLLALMAFIFLKPSKPAKQ